jgi:transcription antitermination factor NusG
MHRWSNFQPGDNVRIIQGTFTGMNARIISVDEALQRELPVRDGEFYWAIIEVFGRDVPVELEPNQMAPAEE